MFEIKGDKIRRTIQNAVSQAKKTKQFNILDFYRQMELVFTENGFREVQKFGVKNILVMRLDAIGDFVLTTAFIRELRLNYPFARITLIVSKLVYPLAELCPYANRVLAFDSKFTGSDMLTVIERVAKFSSENLWQDHYDLAFTVQWGSENLPPILMSYLSGARERIGYGYQIELLHFDKLPPKEQDANYLFLTKPIVNPKELIHEAEKHMYVLKSIGLTVRSTNMELWYSAEDFQNARQLLSGINPNVIKIVVGIGAGGGSRKYSVEQYISAFKSIAGYSNNICFIIIGGKAESEDAAKFMKELPKNCVLNLVEKTTLRETAAIIAQADIFIGNDTGVMHMAAAVHTPIIAVFRQPKDKDNMVPAVFNEYFRFAPWQSTSIVLRPEHAADDCKDAVVYGGCKNPNSHCILQVKPEEIVEAFDSMMYLLKHTHKCSISTGQ